MKNNMLTLTNISKSFGGTNVLQNVSFEIPKVKITALIGPNGAGKTTLFDVVAGVVRQDQGTIKLNNLDISRHEIFERARLGISRTFQQVKLCENLTILDHFEMVKDNEDERLFINVIPGYDPESRNQNQTKKDRNITSYKDCLQSLSLEKTLETRVLDLSYGQRKLLDLGLAMYRKHNILLLDEPVAGVNQIVRKTIHKLLQDLKDKQETVLLIEHDIEFVRAIADTVIVLDEGKLLTHGSPSEVFSNKQVMEAYLGE